MSFLESPPATARLVAAAAPASPSRRASADPAPPARRRGRPLEMSPESVLEAIRRMAHRGEGLFRVHRSHGALYARARRLFGSWSGAVLAAGLDYDRAVTHARRRSIENRRRNGRRLAPSRGTANSGDL